MLLLEPSGILLVFAAGVFALFSPCAFPLLPGYIMYYLGSDVTIKKALPGGAICTLGLITVFSIFGFIGVVIGSLVYPIISLLILVSGIMIIIFGIVILAGLKFPSLTIPIRASSRKGFVGIYLYGIAYGFATFGCSAPIFISILLYSIVSGGILPGIMTFIIYALGMGIPLILTTVLVVTAKELVHNKLVKAMPYLEKISGVLLIIIGIYLLYFYYNT